MKYLFLGLSVVMWVIGVIGSTGDKPIGASRVVLSGGVLFVGFAICHYLDKILKKMR